MSFLFNYLAPGEEKAFAEQQRQTITSPSSADDDEKMEMDGDEWEFVSDALPSKGADDFVLVSAATAFRAAAQKQQQQQQQKIGTDVVIPPNALVVHPVDTAIISPQAKEDVVDEEDAILVPSSPSPSTSTSTTTTSPAASLEIRGQWQDVLPEPSSATEDDLESLDERSMLVLRRRRDTATAVVPKSYITGVTLTFSYSGVSLPAVFVGKELVQTAVRSQTEGGRGSEIAVLNPGSFSRSVPSGWQALGPRSSTVVVERASGKKGSSSDRNVIVGSKGSQVAGKSGSVVAGVSGNQIVY